jgi:hypothetical protein
LRVEVDLAGAQEKYITAGNNIDLSKASFNNALGIDLFPLYIKKPSRIYTVSVTIRRVWIMLLKTGRNTSG